VLCALLASGCLELRERPRPSECTRCHGDARRSGDDVRQAAPPGDLNGQTDPRYPGVGAHARHLDASATHGPVACVECHRVPSSTIESGHADDAGPAEVVFGELARARGVLPKYDPTRHRCSVYCHGGDEPRWTEARSAATTCGSCHGLPPPAPHPASGECHRCHGEVIAADGTFIAPEKHIDGVRQAKQTCSSCHGSADSPAPPADLAGNTSRAAIGVGAHAKHVGGSLVSRAVACSDCHLVPSDVSDAGHLDPAPAEVLFAGVAISHGRQPIWSRAQQTCAASWCHGPSASGVSPQWTQPQSLSCSSCHGQPPSPPHPQVADCARCHAPVIDGAGAIVDRSKHVDGAVQLSLPAKCDACHGTGPLGAPPPALDGSTTSAAVGAHLVHLEGTIRSRKVACSECHQVPSKLTDAGHLDSTLPAEVSFAGVAKAYTAKPVYDGARCQNSYCHALGSLPSGGALQAPLWSAPKGTQSYCGSCHGLPPPAPHPANAACWTCHANVTASYQFVDPSRHVDGKVDF
jgi:predicted CxxxxCH...CXXCH cytochrome family protein